MGSHRPKLVCCSIPWHLWIFSWCPMCCGPWERISLYSLPLPAWELQLCFIVNKRVFMVFAYQPCWSQVPKLNQTKRDITGAWWPEHAMASQWRLIHWPSSLTASQKTIVTHCFNSLPPSTLIFSDRFWIQERFAVHHRLSWSFLLICYGMRIRTPGAETKAFSPPTHAVKVHGHGLQYIFSHKNTKPGVWESSPL